jgi:septum formation protein
MIKFKVPFYLASNSPRRRDMLKLMGIKFSKISADIDEIIDPKLSPIKNVTQLSEKKCREALTKIDRGIVLSADTIVVLNGKIIGKPKSKSDAKKILSQLSGKMHNVYTAFTVADKIKGRIETNYSKTRVFFRDLSKAEIIEYVDTGSPMDKAGAYGIQDDYGAVFVEKIVGCYYNVLGFPISKIHTVLKEFT